MLSVRGAQYRAASGRHHFGWRLGQGIKHFFLDIAEACLSLTFKKFADGAPNPDFYFVV
jgi:hypothetical protein